MGLDRLRAARRRFAGRGRYLGVPMVHSPVVELAGSDLLKATIAIFTSRSYYSRQGYNA